jgi:hypothetical protein
MPVAKLYPGPHSLEPAPQDEDEGEVEDGFAFSRRLIVDAAETVKQTRRLIQSSQQLIRRIIRKN